jgi:hypothetical protein
MPDAPLTFLVPNVRFFLSPNSSCKIFSTVSMEKPQKSDMGTWPFYRGTLSQLLFQFYSFLKNRERHDEINKQKYTNKRNLTYITVNK